MESEEDEASESVNERITNVSESEGEEYCL
jgi:hypothetical protein